MEHIKQLIRPVPDFPKKGVLFRDIAPLLGNPAAFREVVAALARCSDIDGIVALDARGFIFGSAVAVHLGVPLILARKKGKLPGKTVSTAYGLEYGEAVLEMQQGAFPRGSRILVVDDLLATGGTAAAACALIEQEGATVAGCSFVIELPELGGRQKLPGYQINSLITY